MSPPRRVQDSGRSLVVCSQTLRTGGGCVSGEDHHATETLSLQHHAYLWRYCGGFSINEYTCRKEHHYTRPSSSWFTRYCYQRGCRTATTTPGCKYTLGSVLNHVALHQTIIGLEAEKQMQMAGEYPDQVIAASVAEAISADWLSHSCVII